MATLVTRSGKGSPLTHAEVDANFTNLNTDKLELSGGTMTGNLSFGDNDKAIFGAGSDLQIYHTGSQSFIRDVGTGDLRLCGDDLQLRNAATNERYVSCVSDGAVTLYYDNLAKLATTSTGVDVTGTVTADGLTVDGAGSFTSSSTELLDLTSTGGDSLIRFGSLNSNFDVRIGSPSNPSTANGSFVVRTAGDDRLLVANNGDISFYEDTGTTAKFFWDASAESLGIGTSSPAHELHIETVTPEFNIKSTSGFSSIIIDAASGSDGNLLFRSGGTNTARLVADGSDNMIFKNGSGSTERMRIDSSGNVGIGTSSPLNPLDVVETDTTAEAGTVASFRTSAGGYFYIQADDKSASNPTWNIGTATNEQLAFSANNAERMRIDSSGNLLVGMTSYSSTAAGTTMQSGLLTSARSGNIAAYFNRLSSDGSIVSFAKDGTTVGSIGTSGGAIYIGQDDTTLRFDSGGTPSIKPSGTAGATLDATTDLGDGSNRWKDLYLSGGVYLGGTGAANKLDDYESGTWTPVAYNATTATYSHQSGSYVKVGDLVYIQGRLVMSSLGDGNSTRIGGLPFTQSEEATINVSKLVNCAVSFYYFGLRVAGTSLYAHIQDGIDANITINNGFLGNTTEIQFSGTYRAA